MYMGYQRPIGLPDKAKPSDFKAGQTGNGVAVTANPRQKRVEISVVLPKWIKIEGGRVEIAFPRSNFYDGPIQPAGTCMWVPLGLRMVRSVIRAATRNMPELDYARLSLHLSSVGVTWEDIKSIFTTSNPDPRFLWAIDSFTAYQGKNGTGMDLIALGTGRRLDHPLIPVEVTLRHIQQSVDPIGLEEFRDLLGPVFEEKIEELNGIVRSPIGVEILKALRNREGGTVEAFGKRSKIPYFELQCHIIDGTDPIPLKYWVPIAETLSWLTGLEVTVNVLKAMDPDRYPLAALEEIPDLGW